MPRISSIEEVLRSLAASGGHSVPAGAPSERIEAVERELGVPLPKAHRDQLRRADGLELCGGLVSVWSSSLLVQKNRGLTPTKTGVVAPTLRAWVELVVRNGGFGAPLDFDWS